MAMAVPAAVHRHPRARRWRQARRIKRVKLVDRLATASSRWAASSSSSACSFIFVFIFGQALPLFRPAQRPGPGRRVRWPRCRRRTDVAARRPQPLALGIDEYQMYLYEVLPRRAARLLQGAATARSRSSSPRPAWAARPVTAGSRSLDGRLRGGSAPPTAGSRCSRCASLPRYEEQKLVDLDVERRATAACSSSTRRAGPSARSRTRSTRPARSWPAQVADDELAGLAAQPGRGRRAPVRPCSTNDGEKVTAFALGREPIR